MSPCDRAADSAQGHGPSITLGLSVLVARSPSPGPASPWLTWFQTCSTFFSGCLTPSSSCTSCSRSARCTCRAWRRSWTSRVSWAAPQPHWPSQAWSSGTFGHGNRDGVTSEFPKPQLSCASCLGTAFEPSTCHVVDPRPLDAQHEVPLVPPFRALLSGGTSTQPPSVLLAGRPGRTGHLVRERQMHHGPRARTRGHPYSRKEGVATCSCRLVACVDCRD